MNILFISKYPPIQGGVSSENYWTIEALLAEGHTIHVLTNSNEVESGFRTTEIEESPIFGNLFIHKTSPIPIDSHIPWSQPYLSKLIGKGVRLIEKYHCDIIYGKYFEPYSVAASIIGSILSKPVLIGHAGSDLGYLATFSDLQESFKIATKLSTKVLLSVGKNDTLLKKLLEIPENKVVHSKLPKLNDSFSPIGERLNLVDLGKQTRNWLNGIKFQGLGKQQLYELCEKSDLEDNIQILIYGKIGITKGSFDLLKALSVLEKSGVEFTLNVIPCGVPNKMESYLTRILDNPYLNNRTRILPPIHPKDIPRLLRSVNLCCYLERDFPIEMHRPNIPREVIAAGVPLIMSREVGDNQVFCSSIIHDKNFFIIDDPKDHIKLSEELKRIISNLELRNEVGYWGQQLSIFTEAQLEPSTDLARILTLTIKEYH